MWTCARCGHKFQDEDRVCWACGTPRVNKEPEHNAQSIKKQFLVAASYTRKCPYCAEEIQVEAIKCRYCGEWLENRNSSYNCNRVSTQNHAIDAKRLRKHWNNISLVWGIPGLAMQHILLISPDYLAIAVIGTVFLIIGLAYYAKTKGYSPVLGILGIVPFMIGIIILGLLPDRYKMETS